MPRPAPLAVRLPHAPSVPPSWQGKVVQVRSLLAKGSSNPKLAKSDGFGWESWGLSLAPASESGFNVCRGSTAGCRAACLYHQGHARVFQSVKAYRLAKTLALFQDKEWFGAQLKWELGRLAARTAHRRGKAKISVRLNVVSDVAWEREFPGLLDGAPQLRFLDYTKLPARMRRFLGGDLPPNYHLTFSRSERNDAECRRVLAAGGNVAAVFERLPESLWGYPVIDGDQHDLRFLDPSPVVVGLVPKGTARADVSGFVGRLALTVL